MCSPVVCRVCGKITWAGCGLHVEEAMAGIPREQQCAGHLATDPATTTTG